MKQWNVAGIIFWLCISFILSLTCWSFVDLVRYGGVHQIYRIITPTSNKLVIDFYSDGSGYQYRDYLTGNDSYGNEPYTAFKIKDIRSIEFKKIKDRKNTDY